MVVGFHYLEKKDARRRARAAGRPRGTFRLLLLGPLRAHVEYYKDHPESMAWRSATLHAIEAGRGRSGRTGAPGGGCDREGPSQDHAAAGRRVRCAAARERDPASQVLGLRLRAAEGAQGDLLRDRRQERRLLGDAAGFSEEGQGDRALQRHGDLRRQRHRLPALEIRPAGQGLLLPPVSDLRRRARTLGNHGRAGRPPASSSATARRSTT